MFSLIVGGGGKARPVWQHRTVVRLLEAPVIDEQGQSSDRPCRHRSPSEVPQYKANLDVSQLYHLLYVSDVFESADERGACASNG